MLKVLLAGGGTAGHINPALAIASIIKDHAPDTKFLYAGTPNGMESRLVPMEGIDFAPIKVSGFQRRLSVKNIGRNIRAAAYLTTAGHRAKQIIKGFEPDIVIGTGGYVSGPIVMQAAKMKIPTLIHEQNAYPGVTTRILSKKVNKVMLTVPEALEYLDKNIDYTVTGLPVRKGFTNSVSREEAKKQLGFDNGMCILSWGGSLGAGAINDIASALIRYEQENNLEINHIHSYGKMGHDTFEKGLSDNGVDLKSSRLSVKEYIHNMDICTAAADLIICRSGASAISELQAMGRASILVPSPVVAGNHQYHNAMVLGKAGAAVVIEQKDLDIDKVIEKVTELYNAPEKLDSLAQKAGELYIKDTPDRIWSAVEALIKKD
ncbi:MAG: UDP-N-acetylglucosamine--N-acetylmuramyl-(pentapeptide) pyrophosphoryl-undecaprenol N-acetylglucosamine transferase [Oscillospiraceae bacterium]|nr:UDP-N-acetylglucosamine--N-acetylmuramyl-(pentapeptide) pyrophosphoryl-undecaprenol N-acetylglucosamine transferase [Oscillospiraceae bacterium]